MIRIVGMILFFLIGVVVIPLIAPYPSVQGYRGIVNQMMALTFTIFDIGIGGSLVRYVSEYRVKDLRRALEYASFFIWFQAFTGVIQITLVSFWAIFFLPLTNVAYTIWFILAYSLIQWPSSTAIFRDLLKSFQHHDKAELIEFLQTAFIEFFTQISCILIFREWGIQNPQYGELIGITIGWVIGVMLDDIICMIISGKWFNDILKDITKGTVSIVDVIRPHFSKQVVKESVSFGLQNMGASLVSSIQSTILIWLWIELLPSYAFYLGIQQLIMSITVRSGDEIRKGVIPAITESFNNGKTKLTRFYIGTAFKYTFFFIVFMDVLNFIIFPPTLGAVLEVTGEYFVIVATSGAIPISVLVWNFDPLNDFFKEIIKNTGYITTYLLLTIIEVSIDIIGAYIFANFLNLGWFILILYPLPGKITILVLSWIIVNRKISKFKIPYWQSFAAPILSGFIYAGVSYLFTIYITPVFLSIDLIGGSVLVLLVAFLIIPFFVYYPLYTLFGGFDAQGMMDFEKAMLISGPSRWLVSFTYKICRKITIINPLKLYNRFPIDMEGVEEEITELMKLKQISDYKLN